MDDGLLERNRAVRAEMLARIRLGVGRGERSPAAGDSAVGGPRPGALASASHAALKARFIRLALAGASTLVEVATLAEVPPLVAAYLAQMNLSRRAAIWATLGGLDWSGAGIEVAVRTARGDDAVGITGAFCAIAETGSLLCLSGPGSDASTSLLPATHIAVVPASRLVAGMEEAFALVGAEHGQLPRALNFISGPSRTGDIEQTIVLGAHGPARVHLILVSDLG
jgi:L-lactate dehydrogenase complex protein LldG